MLHRSRCRWLADQDGHQRARGGQDHHVGAGSGDLVAEAPLSLANRFIDLAATTGAGTGDLVTLNGATYSLARSPDPDELGLSSRWIGVPLSLSVGSIAYHEDGHPLVEFNGVEWVVEGQL